MTIAGLWRYGDWRRGHGLQRSSYILTKVNIKYSICKLINFIS